jgi:hypothetical protein
LTEDLEVIFGAGLAGLSILQLWKGFLRIETLHVATEKFISEKIAEEPNLGHIVKKFSLENEGAYLIRIDIFTSTSG